MFQYVLRRIIIFIPTLIIISLLAFIISVNAPGDPVERMVVAAQSGGEISTQSANQAEQKRFWRQKLGLDLPVFYVSLGSYANSDTLYRVYDKNKKNALSRLTRKYGNWNEISKWFQSLQRLEQQHLTLKFDSSVYARYGANAVKDASNQSQFETIALQASYEENVIQSKLNQMKSLYAQYDFLSSLKPYLDEAEQSYKMIKEKSTPWKSYVPKIFSYSQNQYHRWIFGDGNWLTGKRNKFSKGIVRGDFGTSYMNKLPIQQVIGIKIRWSLFFTIISVALAYLVSIPLGVRAAAKQGSAFDRTSSVFLFILYSLPSFWIATLLLMTFANPDVIQWFPASGVKPVTGYPEGASFFTMAKLSLPYLILPTICYTYSSFAFLSRTMRVGMLEIVRQDYIRTARAKGLAENVVINKHALRNALLPIITVFANIFPAAIGGSVILETIFTIPGMGYETFVAISNQNYPMIIAVFTIAGVLTLVGYLVSDVLYAIVDPRIRFTK